MSDSPPTCIQDPVEFGWLLDVYRQWAPRKVLEIGTEAGGTLYHWAKHAVNDAIIVSVDHGHRSAYKDSQHLFKSWLAPEAKEMVLIVGDSHDPEVKDKLRELGPFDFIFIDGDHGYRGVKEDWELAKEIITQDAIIAFHDIEADRPRGPCEVFKLWDEIKSDDYVTDETVVRDHPALGRPIGIGIVVFGPGTCNC